MCVFWSNYVLVHGFDPKPEIVYTLFRATVLFFNLEEARKFKLKKKYVS